MKLIDRDNHQKLYMQLYDILRRKIEQNEWTVGTQIPTEEELCRNYNVSRATVRTALLELVRQGYLKRQQGKGTFVSRKVVTDGLIMLTSLNDLMLEDESDLSLRVLAKTVMMPVDDLSKLLRIQHDKHIIYIKRLWSSKTNPVVFQEAFIPYHICPLLIEEDIEHDALLQCLEKKYGIKITEIKNYFESLRLRKEESNLLNVSDGSNALVLSQHFFSGDTKVMFARTVNSSSAIKLFMDLERKAA